MPSPFHCSPHTSVCLPSQIATGLADTIMQQFFSERRHYREYKTELSPDFSDVRAKVEQLEKQSQSRQQKAMNYA